MANKPEQLPEVHCTSCGRFLGFAFVMLGIAEFKCPKCKQFTTISNFPEDVDKRTTPRYTRGRKVGKVA